MHVNLTRTDIHHQTHICQSHWALQDDAVEMVLDGGGGGGGGGSDGSSDGGTEWNGISRMCMGTRIPNQQKLLIKGQLQQYIFTVDVAISC
ncbi:Hypothetical predicted protein [Octopus vulgaris]|uniref:Uncharacterized protein n=1 Tax=Octopus vulgaris TaxID=6645 RepID=A0AA36BT44_OCTVU|nr:Hypothetical predicted protein [Octopus vulgaris]